MPSNHQHSRKSYRAETLLKHHLDEFGQTGVMNNGKVCSNNKVMGRTHNINLQRTESERPAKKGKRAETETALSVLIGRVRRREGRREGG